MMRDLIDYSEESTEDDPSTWTHTAFKHYFCDTYFKVHRVGGAVPWHLAETHLLSGIMKEFSASDLANMMVYWHTNTPKASVASNFKNFYSNRIDVYHKMKQATGEYTWD